MKAIKVTVQDMKRYKELVYKYRSNDIGINELIEMKALNNKIRRANKINVLV